MNVHSSADESANQRTDEPRIIRFAIRSFADSSFFPERLSRDQAVARYLRNSASAATFTSAAPTTRAPDLAPASPSHAARHPAWYGPQLRSAARHRPGRQLGGIRRQRHRRRIEKHNVGFIAQPGDQPAHRRATPPNRQRPSTAGPLASTRSRAPRVACSGNGAASSLTAVVTPAVVPQPEQGVLGRMAQVAIDQDHALADPGKRHGQICDDCGLVRVRAGGRNEKVRRGISRPADIRFTRRRR